MNLKEKHTAELGYPKEETRLNLKKNLSKKKRLDTLVFNSSGIVLQNE